MLNLHHHYIHQHQHNHLSEEKENFIVLSFSMTSLISTCFYAKANNTARSLLLTMHQKHTPAIQATDHLLVHKDSMDLV